MIFWEIKIFGILTNNCFFNYQGTLVSTVSLELPVCITKLPVSALQELPVLQKIYLGQNRL